MACGMIVAPSIDVASRTELESAKRGSRPEIAEVMSGGATTTPAVNPTAMITSKPTITNSNGRGPHRDCRMRSTIETAPVMRPPQRSGIPKSRLSATAPPITSAISVAIATSSACTQYARRDHRLRMRLPSTSGRLRPVTIPSFAERYWMSQAMRFPSTTTHTSR